MIRLVGLSEAIREAFPAEYADAYAGVTHLGDPGVLTLLLAVLYWGYRRESTAQLVGYAFVAFSLTVLLKGAFALPRPPASVRLIETTGYGFPSGHAIAGAVVYGGMAVEFGWLESRLRTAAVATVGLAVGFSRVVLGVHYLGDVLVGFVIGGLVLLVGRNTWAGRPIVGYAVAAVVAVPALLVTGASELAVTLFGSCLGGVVGCRVLSGVDVPASWMNAAAITVLGLAFVVAFRELGATFDGSIVGMAVHDAVLVAGILALPAIVRAARDAIPVLPDSTTRTK
ncbi:phosphatase PAP2 family protein [Haloarchaeobius sp. HME9146]|uniref:phosphatase PAP2 family protein n=1 Tax=Haloarchaeobius sp. HME9146 TaxID=2978732 RepID=UPI0021BEF2D6|nr:phosphatase PAP2 family protein [Haloarchaeobius sp. HME9146]MCT9097098.1 phosphatase PAP2 family protein [Haloarchaeobius sp. HME9146]